MAAILSGPAAFVNLLKDCAKQKNLCKGIRLHADIVKSRLLQESIYLGNALINMYAKCGALAKAQEVLDKLPVRDVVSWNALITGFVEHEHGEEALKCFERMQHEGLFPNGVTFVCVLKACGSTGAAHKGQEIHSAILSEGLVQNNISVGNALVDMYVKCGAVAKAQEAFDELPFRTVVSWNALIAGYAKCGALRKAQDLFAEIPVRDVVSWTALIAGYAQHGHGEEAINVFDQMQHEGLNADSITFICTLKACGSIGAADKGQKIHAQITRGGLVGKNIMVGTALVDMYAKCGKLEKAQEVFDILPIQDVVAWTALIAGYVQHGYGEEALDSFEQMQYKGLSPNAVTFVCILKACGNVGAFDKGQKVHAQILRKGSEGRNLLVGNALVDMYAKCGAVAQAQAVFEELPTRDVVSWNALIAGYAQLGKVDIVFNLFEKMVKHCLNPNLITFTLVLNTCSHSGLLDKGQMCFKCMSIGHVICPTSGHYTCMVDLFGRAGHFDKAVALIKEMPFPADFTMWLSVLSACRKWRNVKLGKLAFEHAVQLDEKEAAAYDLMRDIYAAAGMQADLSKVEDLRVNKDAWKKPKLGWTWCPDVSGDVSSLFAGTRDS